MLTQLRLKEVLAYDPISGCFQWLSSRNPAIKEGEVAGTVSQRGYISITVDGCQYQAHVLAFLYMTGKLPSFSIDHINGQKADNKWGNLRAATHSENLQNQRRAHRNSQSGYLGVAFHKASGKFQANIRVNGKIKYLGLFTTAAAAHQTYLDAKRQIHPFCTI